MSEASIQNRILLALSEAGATVFRQNTGMGYVGEVTRLRDGSVLIKNPRPLHAGLCKGSSDIIGMVPVVVTDEMVGQTLARFVAVEVKDARGRPSPEQTRFIDHALAQGAAAGVARSTDDALSIIKIPGKS